MATVLNHKPILIKIGTAVLTQSDGRLDEGVMSSLASQCHELMENGQKLCLVSSGAIQAGLAVLGQKRCPASLGKKQALSAIGQVHLMASYSRLFAEKGLRVAQVLLSHESISQREGFINTRKTITELMDLGVVPIINENDTVSTEEIQFGDNDQLAVMSANIIDASGVIFLSAVSGLINYRLGKEVVPEVAKIDDEILAMARGGNKMGSGGMGSKLMAIDSLVKSGRWARLADGREEGVVLKVLKGRQAGTYFHPAKKQVSSKQQWMSQHLKPHGQIWVDEGAHRALLSRGASLLSPGIVKVEGNFKAGQLVSLCYGKAEFARGMSRVGSEIVRSCAGKPSEALKEKLGDLAPKFIVHRNDIVILSQ